MGIGGHVPPLQREMNSPNPRCQSILLLVLEQFHRRDLLNNSQPPQSLQRFEDFLDLLDAGFGTFAEVGGEGGGIGAGGGEEFLDGGDLG